MMEKKMLNNWEIKTFQFEKITICLVKFQWKTFYATKDDGSGKRDQGNAWIGLSNASCRKENDPLKVIRDGSQQVI